MPRPAITQNTLCYGDNLPILREYVADGSLDLVYLDPPFNSSRNYNLLFKDERGAASAAQITAFEDTWHWDWAAQATYPALVTPASPRVVALSAALCPSVPRCFRGALLLLLMTALASCDTSPFTSPLPRPTPSSVAHGSAPALHRPEPEAAADVARAIQAFAKADYGEAWTQFDAAVQIDPNYPKAYLGRGATYAKLHDDVKAVADYTQAIQLDPGDSTAYYDRGLENNVLGNFEAAISDFTQAIALQPGYADAFDDRGVAYAREHDYAEALGDFNQALALKPDFVLAYRNRAIAYAEQQDYAAAIKDFTRIIALQPDTISFYFDRAKAYEVAQDFAAERKDLEKVVALSKDPQLTAEARAHLTLIKGR